MTDPQRSTSNPAGVHPPIGRYSQVLRARLGETLYLAGQMSIDSEGNLVGEGDAKAQTLKVFENIGKLLESAGASFDNVVEFTSYLVGKESLQPFLDARTEFFATAFPKGDYPPNTLLIIDGLAQPELLVEITATAALP